MTTLAQVSTRVVVVTHESSALHQNPPGHPESTARLGAVEAALTDPALSGRLEHTSARSATDSDLARVHNRSHIDQIREAIESGASHFDADTFLSADSWSAAMHAAGAGLTAIAHLDNNPDLEGAFVAARPPGHHATADTAMGFCLFNNVAVAASHLADRGERVLVVDWDVHHGNGTQDIFWNDPRICFVSLHEAAIYPFSGRIHERGGPDALGATANLAMPSGATGDVYREAISSVVEVMAETFEPTWVLVSAGFDAHHMDPLSDMGLTSGDYRDLTRQLRALAPGTSRTVAFLEGGYSLEGLRRSVLSTVASLANVEIEEESPSSGGPGLDTVREAADVVKNSSA